MVEGCRRRRYRPFSLGEWRRLVPTLPAIVPLSAPEAPGSLSFELASTDGSCDGVGLQWGRWARRRQAHAYSLVVGFMQKELPPFDHRCDGTGLPVWAAARWRVAGAVGMGDKLS
jgi:hypothetical protein